MRRQRRHFYIAFGDLEYETTVTRSGPGWSIRIGIEDSHVLPEGAELWLWLRSDGNFIEASNETWADFEGHLCVHAQWTEDDDGRPGFSATLPFVALPPTCPRQVDLYAELQDEDERLMAECAWALSLPSHTEREQGHVLGAFVGAAADVCGLLEAVHRQRIESFLADAWELDEDGVFSVRQTVSRRLDGLWSPRAWEEALSELDAQEQELLAEFLLQVLVVGGGPTREESEDVEMLFEEFAFDANLWRRCRERYARGSKESSADGALGASFAVLELDVTSDWSAVRRAYRRLASDYHPDKVANLPTGFQQFATERTQQIVAAYEELKRHFGR